MKDDIKSLTVLDAIQSPPAYVQYLAQHDCVHISTSDFLHAIPALNRSKTKEFCKSWSNLSTDTFMADGGKYRQRRHTTFSATRADGPIQQEAAQPHFQSSRSNPVNGGVERNFQPVEDHVAKSETLHNVLPFGSQVFGTISPLYDWEIEVHQFRIIAEVQGGNSTPEGVHQDGVDFVLVLLIERNNIIMGKPASLT